MGSALIGILGIIVGALLTGAVTARQENRQRRLDAASSGRLVASELRVVHAIVGGCLDSGKWMSSPLPTAAWQSHDFQIASVLPVAGLVKVYEAVDSTNKGGGFHIGSATPATGPPKELTDKTRPVFEELERQVGKAIQRLDENLNALRRELPEKRPLRWGWAKAWKVVVAVAVLAFVTLAIVYASVPREHTTSESLASAITKELEESDHNNQYTTDCDATAADDSDWLCHVTQITRRDSNGLCSVTSAARAMAVAHPATPVELRSLPAGAAAADGCAAGHADFEATDSSGNTVAVVPVPAPGKHRATDPSEAWASQTMAILNSEAAEEEAPGESWFKVLFG